MKTLRYTSLALLVVLVLALVGAPSVGTSDASAKLDLMQVGTVYAYRGVSPRVLGAAWSTTVASQGATFIRLHFVGVNLAKGDTLVVSRLDGSDATTYVGRGSNGNGDFWSNSIDGDAVQVVVNNASGKSRGFRIAEVGHGTAAVDTDASAQVVCGNEGREGIACHLNDSVINNAQKTVARLLYTDKGKQYLCTGELVAGSNNSTLITNNHCIANQTVASTLEARFKYQYTTCGGSTLDSQTIYNGSTFLKTSPERNGLDYTLLTLANFGNPEATWGELTPTSQDSTVGQQINFIQHGGGNPKQIGYWEDSAHTIRCKVDTINMTYGNATNNSQLGYGCDSEGGSSGSSITRASDGRMVGLHHYGGVSASPCLNSGTMMSKICTDAGSLLNCVSN